MKRKLNFKRYALMHILLILGISATHGWAQENTLSDTIEVRAAKYYNPAQQQDFIQVFDHEKEFSLPEYFQVTEGNAGNAYATLYIKYNNAIVSVSYVGESSTLHPATSEDITLGLRYRFHSSSAGLVPGDLIHTDYIKFEIVAGDYLAGTTRVALDIVTLVTDLYVGQAKNAELSYGSVKQMSLPDVFKFKGDYTKLRWSYTNSLGQHEVVYKKNDPQSTAYLFYSSSEGKAIGDLIDLSFFKMEFIKE